MKYSELYSSSLCKAHDIFSNKATFTYYSQVPDFLNAKIDGLPVKKVITDHEWLEHEFTEKVQKVSSKTKRKMDNRIKLLNNQVILVDNMFWRFKVISISYLCAERW